MNPHAAQPRPAAATLILLLVCVIWAGAFVSLKIGAEPLHEIDREHAFAASALFLFVRFALATVFLVLAFPRTLAALTRRDVAAGATLGACFSAHLLTQQVGLSFADMQPGHAAFLTALFVVIAPLLAFIFQGRRPRAGVLLGVPLAVVGAAYIGGPPETSLTVSAWLNIIAAAIYGVQIVITDTLTRKGDAMAQTLAMIAACAVVNGIAFVVAPGASDLAGNPGLGGAVFDSRFWGTELYLAVVSTVVALALVNRWQREVSPNRAAILYTSTPVFASAISVIAGMETIGGWMLFGAAMILLANLCAQFIGRKSA